MTECIHGLPIEECDLCSPRAVPEVVRPRVMRTPGAPTRSARSAAGGAAPAREAVQARSSRLAYASFAIEELGALDGIEAAWSPLIPESVPRDRVVVARDASGEVTMIAVPNEPVRSAARPLVAKAVRVVVQPAWFLPA